MQDNDLLPASSQEDAEREARKRRELEKVLEEEARLAAEIEKLRTADDTGRGH